METTESPAPTETSAVLTYLKGTSLMQVEIPSGRKEKLGEVASQDVSAIPGSQKLLVVADSGGGEDFAVAPELSELDPATAEVRSIGEGFGPLVHPTGSRFAFLRPAGERVCEGEACFGGVEVMMAELGSSPEVLLGAGQWHLLGWAGDDLLVSGGARPGAFLVSPEGDRRRLPVPPSEVWDASPDGQHLIVVEGNRTSALNLASEEPGPLELDAPLAEGAWSPSGDLVAVELAAGGSRLVLVSVDDGAVAEVPGSRGAMGPVNWSDEGDSFSYVRARGVELEAVVCRPDGGCSTALRWKEGILPLSLARP